MMTAVTRKPANTDGLYIVVSIRKYLSVTLTEKVFFLQAVLAIEHFKPLVCGGFAAVACTRD
jgi:hypothetical protein